MQLLCEVTSQLLISDARSACASELLRQEAVTLCVNVTRRQPLPEAPIAGLRVAVSDRPDEDLYLHLEACVDTIRAEVRNGGRCLVYCKNGRSRSAAVCAAYLMKHRRLPLADALQKVKAARPVIAPNAGFLEQLQRYEDDLRKRLHSPSPHRRTTPDGPTSALQNSLS
ncbi:dual specificity phosphatase 28 [Corythoichthys intestinalis]|uniref:dual specificity phosphatase 28 n=1 Tax=Corythoichthys intestinalis TaxID=161448 RepID=UPI0025A62AE7|nr:dual specificity phosphatase 28 [Corythoichthys intestinalis]XP_057712537.1 dual specificity phosphatase 28 [Corythoichthys intestinalis]XP_057712538.1 dual specificity phosphatase 28 [Corythoichthys intestinalis]XP_057712539.1 dual specificity phosphatase 28 [Corythoichthys intestinalis]XP_057712540.1 dual specificity phosphatase 28 [Corythoichthys intestinalis]XP_061795378.1 dual specificity phosphatase 28-like [Nerophis lumbriciformis]